MCREFGQRESEVFVLDALNQSLLKFFFLSGETERARDWLRSQVHVIRLALMKSEILFKFRKCRFSILGSDPVTPLTAQLNEFVALVAQFGSRATSFFVLVHEQLLARITAIIARDFAHGAGLLFVTR